MRTFISRCTRPPPWQRFRARANTPSGHAVWPAMRTGESISAHAKALPLLPITANRRKSDNVTVHATLILVPAPLIPLP